MTKICALTCGEPASIAAELIVKAWRAGVGPFFVVGPPELYTPTPIHIMARIDEAIEEVFKTHLPCFPLVLPKRVTWGVIDRDNTAVAIESITLATHFVHQNPTTHALVTLPIEKKACYDAGFAFAGHTEFLAHQAHVAPSDVVMMLACLIPQEPSGRWLQTVPLTIHMPFRQVPGYITQERIMRQVRVLAKELPEYSIAVAALNPHAGEQGTMGDEEIQIIQPAIEKLKAQGVSIHGPYPADTLFAECMRPHYDVALCMYHDQALIPIKTLNFHGGINRTLGLGFTRTSPDHGTGLAISGRQQARPDSLIAAIRCAQQLVNP